MIHAHSPYKVLFEKCHSYRSSESGFAQLIRVLKRDYRVSQETYWRLRLVLCSNLIVDCSENEVIVDVVCCGVHQLDTPCPFPAFSQQSMSLKHF